LPNSVRRIYSNVMLSCLTIDSMYSFVKSFKKADQTRRYSIRSTGSGWEVREEQDAEILRHSHYQDWHRVERARLAIALKVNVLREQGWREI
jgi:hypothetical protein